MQEYYKDALYRKQQVHQMNKLKEQYDHTNYLNQGAMNHDHSLKEYNDTLAKHTRIREFKTAVGYVPVDERIQQKEMAIENMQKQA